MFLRPHFFFYDVCVPSTCYKIPMYKKRKWVPFCSMSTECSHEKTPMVQLSNNMSCPSSDSGQWLPYLSLMFLKDFKLIISFSLCFKPRYDIVFLLKPIIYYLCATPTYVHSQRCPLKQLQTPPLVPCQSSAAVTKTRPRWYPPLMFCWIRLTLTILYPALSTIIILAVVDQNSLHPQLHWSHPPTNIATMYHYSC